MKALHKILCIVSSILSLGLVAQKATGQDLSALRGSLTTSQATYLFDNSIELLLVVEATVDTVVPGSLLTGKSLEIRIDGQSPRKLEEEGKGGPVTLLAGTRIGRVITLAASTLGVESSIATLGTVALSWVGVPGATCTVKVAPDMSKLDITTLDLMKTRVVLVTSHGDLTLSFRPDKAPRTVENFLKLCKSRFYDGTKFHRVIRNFMIQGGDPYSKDISQLAKWGQGDPGYKIAAEFSDLRHVRGTLSMARSADPNSAGSQFFIVHKDSNHLDNQYSAFGNLESGQDTLDRIASVQCASGDRPMEPVIIYSAVILPVKK